MGFNPHGPQILFSTSQARFRNACAGRRGGKSEISGKEGGAYTLGPYRICLFGPTYNECEKEFRVIKEFVQHPAYPYHIERLIDNKQAGNMIIKTSIGAEVECKSASNLQKSPIIGEEYDLVILCETAKLSNMGGEGGVWETQLRGNLTTRLGDMFMPTTPAGKDDFLYPRFNMGLKGPNKHKDHDSFQWAAYCNPNYFEDVGEMYKLMSRRAFAEQVEGDFVSWTGAIWAQDCGWNQAIHEIASFTPPSWWRRYEVLDPGWSDDLVWIAAVVDHRGIVYIVDEFKMPKTSYEHIAEQILRRRENMYARQDMPTNIPLYVDPEDPRCAFELTKAAQELGGSILAIPADNDVTSGFLMASARIRSGMFYVTASCPGVSESLSNHEWSDRENSRGKIEKRDRYKHYSDVSRYLNLVPMQPSIIPVAVTRQTRATYRDLYNPARSGNAFTNPFVGGNRALQYIKQNFAV